MTIKKIIIISTLCVLVMGGLSILAHPEIKCKSKYIIRQGSNIYWTNEYTIDSNRCIKFINQCGCKTKNEITVCGNYNLEKEN